MKRMTIQKPRKSHKDNTLTYRDTPPYCCSLARPSGRRDDPLHIRRSIRSGHWCQLD